MSILFILGCEAKMDKDKEEQNPKPHFPDHWSIVPKKIWHSIRRKEPNQCETVCEMDVTVLEPNAVGLCVSKSAYAPQDIQCIISIISEVGTYYS
jgi:hypothetical protein